MSKKSKLELVMELADKLFNNKLSQVQAKLSNATDKMEGKLKKFNVTQIKIFSKIGESFDPVKINQAFELFDTVSEKLNFTDDINKTKLALQQMGVGNIDEVSGKIHEIKTVFEEDSIQIAKAANAMTKQIGGSFEENLALLQAGYEKGANLNGDMLDQFKEYGPQINELGLNASQMLAIMARAGKDGIFSDKAIDSIKEANLSLKEMGPTQLDALKGIGLGVKDLAGKTSFEAVQIISKAMQGASAQAKQLALTDIFKGAGEDAGMGFILGLGSMDLDPNNMPSFQAADAGMKSWMAKFQAGIADTLGNLPIQNIANFTMTIMGLISVLTTLNSTIPLTTLVTKGLSLAMKGIPLFALIGLIVLAISKWDEWGAALLTVGSIVLSVFTKFMGPIGFVIGLLKTLYDHWDSIKEAFQSEGILGGLKRIAIVLVDAILKPLQQILEFFGIDSWASKLKEFRTGLDLVTPEETEPKPITPTDNAPKTPLIKPPVIDGNIIDPNGKGKGGGKKTDGDVNKVAGQANQVRKVEIKIDAFNKGGINVAQSAYAGMTKDDVEAWFKEMMRRVVVNAEIAS